MDQEALSFLESLERGGEENRTARTNNDEIVPPGERECPICKRKMKLEVQFHVMIDVCEEHGLWLDRDELASIASRIRSGERVGRIQAVQHARREGKLSGALWGLWSLWYD